MKEERPGSRFAGVSDHDLLAGGVADIVAENRSAAQRWARMHEFHRRLGLDYKARKADEPHFTLTPLQETKVEVGELWGLSPGRVEGDLARVGTLVTHFPQVWEMCLDGQLDTYRAGMIADASKTALGDDGEYAEVADRLTRWLRSGVEDGEARFMNRTVKQLRNKLTYELNRVRPRDANERFAAAFKNRRASTFSITDGMACLTLSSSLPAVQLADYRLTLIAQWMREQGDERTVDQLRTDLAIDLILGKVRVNASLGELDAASGESLPEDWITTLPTSDYARPVINVTVPLQTLMGVSDTPGVLSGGEVLPAALVRMIADDPDSTWLRMLTDPDGGFLELSTKSYRPTKPIWLDMVAKFNSCFRSNCDRPATESDGDHVVPWPKGRTSSRNLQPGCPRDHKAKHARGFAMGSDGHGSSVFRTRAGFTHPVRRAEHPVEVEAVPAELFDLQFSATEFFDTVEHLRRVRAEAPLNQLAEIEERLLVGSYAQAYPDASDEEIDYWVHGDEIEGEEAHYAPPLPASA